VLITLNCPKNEINIKGNVITLSFEMVEKLKRGLNWLVKNLGYLCKLKTTFN